ncbi:MAG: ATP-binding protein [Collinsella aerofaciens]
MAENAIRYGRSGSTVNVSISDSDNHVFLRVEDRGPGIPEQYRESIFQPFFAWINPAAGHTAQDSD